MAGFIDRTKEVATIWGIRFRHTFSPNPETAKKVAVIQTYSDILRRLPDSEGFRIYTEQLREGRSLIDIREEIAKSMESTDRLTREQVRRGRERVVRDLYRGVLHRSPDLVGLRDYVVSRRTIEEVRDSIVESEEHQLVAAQMMHRLVRP